jgi:hypothetical protein
MTLPKAITGELKRELPYKHPYPHLTRKVTDWINKNEPNTFKTTLVVDYVLNLEKLPKYLSELSTRKLQWHISRIIGCDGRYKIRTVSRSGYIWEKITHDGG